MRRHSFKIDNIHCSGCEEDITSVFHKQDARAQVQFLQNRGIVQLQTEKDDFDFVAALEELHAHGFDIEDMDRGQHGTPSAASANIGSVANKIKAWFSRSSPKPSERKQNHAEICLECGGDPRHDSNYHDDEAADEHRDTDTATPDSKDAYRAVFAVEGMTCASCASSITSSVKSSVPEAMDVSADPINGSAFILLRDRSAVTRAAQAIDDAGFSSTLTELLPLSSTNVKEYSITASVSGMTCASCSTSVKTALEGLRHVAAAKVEVLDGRAQITVTEKIPLSELKSTVEDLGYEIEFVGGYTEVHSAQAKPRARTVTLEVQGIYCDRCPSRIMDALKEYGDAVDIVDAVSVSTPYVKFTYLPSPPKLTIRSIIAKLAEANPDLGFTVVRPKSLEEIAAENQLKEKQGITRRLVLASVISIPAILIMLNPKLMMDYRYMLALSTPVYFFAADIFHRKAIKEIKVLLRSPRPWRRRLLHFGSMNLLMSLGTSISYWASIAIIVINWRSDAMLETDTYFDSVIFLAFFLLVGRYLDIYSKIKTTSAVSMVSETRPDTVELYDCSSDSSKRLPIDLIEVGDLVLVLSGQRSAVDGVVQKGSSDFDESMLTGESLPVPKTVGDEVYAGTLNSGNQRVVMKVTAVGQGTLLNDIVDAVRTGQMQRAPIEQFVEQFTGMFVPLVVYLALLIWLVWFFVTSDVLWSMQFAIATFVVACPCGIGLAAPTALYVGSGLSAKYGILARGGGEAFQEGSGLQVICFDKTGTITVGGDLRITDTWGAESDEAIQLAVRMESDSVHPLAKAVIEYGQGRKFTNARCENIVQISNRGRGMHAEVTNGEFEGKTAVLGNERVIKEVAGVEASKEQQKLLSKWKNEGKSVVLLAIKGHGIVLMLAAADQIRRESRGVIHQLHGLGLQCWMISGDNEVTAKAVARKVGVPENHVIAGVLPQQKADKVRDLQVSAGAETSSQYGRTIVGMVGDGINDAPALATSDVGIALGRGADIALSSSQFVLLREDLRGLPVLIEISKAVISKVKANFFWAAIYNFIAIPVAAGVLYPWTHKQLNPVWASLAMALSSVSVMTNSLLLRRYRPKDL